MHARHNDPGEIYPRAIALQRVGIRARTQALRLERNPGGVEEFEIWLIAYERENKVILHCYFAVRSVNSDRIRPDFHNPRVEISRNFSVLDSIFDVRLDPVLHAIRNRRAAMDQRDARAGPP